MGRGSTSTVGGGALPKVHSVEPWDGKDGEVRKGGLYVHLIMTTNHCKPASQSLYMFSASNQAANQSPTGFRSVGTFLMEWRYTVVLISISPAESIYDNAKVYCFKV